MRNSSEFRVNTCNFIISITAENGLEDFRGSWFKFIHVDLLEKYATVSRKNVLPVISHDFSCLAMFGYSWNWKQNNSHWLSNSDLICLEIIHYLVSWTGSRAQTTWDDICQVFGCRIWMIWVNQEFINNNKKVISFQKTNSLSWVSSVQHALVHLELFTPFLSTLLLNPLSTNMLQYNTVQVKYRKKQFHRQLYLSFVHQI